MTMHKNIASLGRRCARSGPTTVLGRGAEQSAVRAAHDSNLSVASIPLEQSPPAAATRAAAVPGLLPASRDFPRAVRPSTSIPCHHRPRKFEPVHRRVLAGLLCSRGRGLRSAPGPATPLHPAPASACSHAHRRLAEARPVIRSGQRLGVGHADRFVHLLPGVVLPGEFRIPHHPCPPLISLGTLAGRRILHCLRL